MSSRQPGWMEQFVLHGSGQTEALTPFAQAKAAAELLAVVAEDRTGLAARDYPVVGSAQYQARILAELAQQLHDQVAQHSADAEASRKSGDDPSRALMASLTGVVRTTATLVEVCHALLRVAESLLVVRTAKSRVELAAAVETLRAAVGTSQITVQANLSRITDARTYDQLVEGLPTFARIREGADRVAESLRRQTAPASFVTQRAPLVSAGPTTVTTR